jgi:hypothetical protein
MRFAIVPIVRPDDRRYVGIAVGVPLYNVRLSVRIWDECHEMLSFDGVPVLIFLLLATVHTQLRQVLDRRRTCRDCMTSSSGRRSTWCDPGRPRAERALRAG